MIEFKPKEETGLEDTSWKITTDVEAGWAIQKINQLEKETKEWEDEANAYHKMIDDWLESQSKSNTDSIAWFRAKLYLYQKTKEKRTVTPFGTLSVPKPHQSLVVTDESKAIKSLLNAGLTDMVKTTQKVKRGDLKKLIVNQNGTYVDTETGAIIDGIELKLGEEKLSITKPKIKEN